MTLRSLGFLTRDAVVARARSAIGKPTVYWLGKGGRDPSLPHPGWSGGDGHLYCDCSGFAAWCVGRDRFLPNAGLPESPGYEWFETSNLAQDAQAPGGIVNAVLWQDALPGDLLVWGDRKDADGTRHEGHIGVIASLGQTGPETVVHCSVGNLRKFTDAIHETGVEIFLRNKALVARVAWVA